MENAKVQSANSEVDSVLSAEPAANVIRFPTERREPPATDAELEEYRRIRPQLLQMLAEWQRVRVMCPMAARLTHGDDD